MQTSSNHNSVTNQSGNASPAPTAPTLSAAHEALLAELFATGCHINKLLETHNLTPSQFLAFATDPVVIQTLDAWEALQERHHRILARQAQLVAADHLDLTLMKAHPSPEARRVTTTLTTLTTHMMKPPRPNASPARGGKVGGGGGGRTQQGRRGAFATTHPTSPTLTTSWTPHAPASNPAAWVPRLTFQTPPANVRLSDLDP